MRAVPLSSCLLLWAVTLHGQTTSNHKSATLSWGPAPAVFPQGAQMAVVSGDPGKAAPFTVELSMPDGYRIPPHFHPTDETVEVKKGTFLLVRGRSGHLGRHSHLPSPSTARKPKSAWSRLARTVRGHFPPALTYHLMFGPSPNPP
jgi:hypothetical protein